jgi:hypothetical protein
VRKRLTLRFGESFDATAMVLEAGDLHFEFFEFLSCLLFDAQNHPFLLGIVYLLSELILFICILAFELLCHFLQLLQSSLILLLLLFDLDKHDFNLVQVL